MSPPAASVESTPNGTPKGPPVEARVQPPRRVDGSLDFEAIYNECFDFVWRSVRRLGVIDSALDDVVQDVFLTVHRRLPSFEGKSSLKSWVFGIALHVVRDKRRSLRRKPGHLGSAARTADDVDAMAADASGPHERVAKLEAVRVLHELLDAMPDDRREVFILAELEEMSVPEIAEAVGANVNTVYSRLRAARADFERGVARAKAGDEWRTR